MIAQLTAAKEPALVGPFAKLGPRLDLSFGAAKRRAPELFGGGMRQTYEYTSPDYPNARFLITRGDHRMYGDDDDRDHGYLEDLRIRVPRSDVRARLEAAWGPPRLDDKHPRWYAPAHRIRASWSESTHGDCLITFETYVPLADFIGTEPSAFGFEGDPPLIGQTWAQLRRRFGPRLLDDGRILLPVTEIGDWTPLELHQLTSDRSSKKLEGWKITFPHDQRAALEALLARKFGAAKTVDDSRVYRASSPRVVLDRNELVVGRYEDN